MQAREMQPPIAAPGSAPGLAPERIPDPFDETPAGRALRPVRQMLSLAQETARRMLEAEDALHLVGERFQRTEDAQARAELAAEGLEHVERGLGIVRARRRQLDSIEGNLWARRNRLERFLIHARGRAWWQARRRGAQAETQRAGHRSER
jgi:hypothetical protein